MNGSNNPTLYAGAVGLVPTEKTLLTSAPKTHGSSFFRCNTTPVGPRPRLLFPKVAALCVGSWMIGPTPHTQSLGAAGDRNPDIWRSPMPPTAPTLGPRSGLKFSGKIVRVMRFQFAFSETGITGWIWRFSWTPRLGP